jgi:hypothetical protein
MIQHKICKDTVRVSRPGLSEQNAQWIWSSLLTTITIMGCNMILVTGPPPPPIIRAVALLLVILAFKSHQRPV